eukprot:2306819-Ditylum_brightwellii.AAC.1
MPSQLIRCTTRTPSTPADRRNKSSELIATLDTGTPLPCITWRIKYDGCSAVLNVADPSDAPEIIKRLLLLKP